ncbi:hypothetical protein C8Q78DRAFT_507744 [Trametes maxima]|nr:hypothetical protein C8Q78DRAFT_507744 [Trametes maxima]
MTFVPSIRIPKLKRAVCIRTRGAWHIPPEPYGGGAPTEMDITGVQRCPRFAKIFHMIICWGRITQPHQTPASRGRADRPPELKSAWVDRASHNPTAVGKQGGLFSDVLSHRPLQHLQIHFRTRSRTPFCQIDTPPMSRGSGDARFLLGVPSMPLRPRTTAVVIVGGMQVEHPSRRRPPFAGSAPPVSHLSAANAKRGKPGDGSSELCDRGSFGLARSVVMLMKQDRDKFVPGAQDLGCGPKAEASDLAGAIVRYLCEEVLHANNLPDVSIRRTFGRAELQNVRTYSPGET